MNKRILTITSYNIHKGMSTLNLKVQIQSIAKELKQIDSDIIFLQEVQGFNLQKGTNQKNSLKKSHDEIIAEYLNYYNSYGKNAVFKSKHHGNAILSKFPIKTKLNIDISTNRFEQRGLLHCKIRPNDWDQTIECFCVHLNLMEQERQKQYERILQYLIHSISIDNPVILAGDFNDWAYKSFKALEKLDLKETFITYQSYHPRTFPAKLPILSLDRIFVRNLEVLSSKVHKEYPWSKLSDHLPISATVCLP